MSLPDDIDPDALLRGEYDAEWLPDDFSAEHPLPDFDTHVLSRQGLLDQPVLDTGGYRDGTAIDWPEGKQFAVCLTHDIDHVSSHSPAHELRRGLLRSKKRLDSRRIDGPTVTRSGIAEATKGAVGGGIRAMKAALTTGEDPYHRWDEWLQVEADVGAKSTFFVHPDRTGREHVTDSVYRYADPVTFEGETRTLSAVLAEVNSRGWEVGLHGSWYSYDDSDEMEFQKEQVESAIGEAVVSVRQHWLHHDIRKTPRVQQEAGLRYDSTLGPKGAVGFRFGTSYPWRLYDLDRNEHLDLVEVPLIVQDTALFDSKYGSLTPEEAFERVTEITEEIKRAGGVLTVNWHNNVPADRWAFYDRLLGYLAAQDPWFATVREVGNWWAERSTEIESIF